MIRTITVDKDTTLAELSREALGARSRDGRAEAALERFRQLNPHVDPERLTAGAVLLVPDLPGLKPSASTAPAEAPWSEIKGLLDVALGDAARSVGAGIDARSAARAEMAKRMRAASFRKALKESELPDTFAKDAAEEMKASEKKERDALETLGAVSEAVRHAVTRLDEVIRRATG